MFFELKHATYSVSILKTCPWNYMQLCIRKNSFHYVKSEKKNLKVCVISMGINSPPSLRFSLLTFLYRWILRSPGVNAEFSALSSGGRNRTSGHFLPKRSERNCSYNCWKCIYHAIDFIMSNLPISCKVEYFLMHSTVSNEIRHTCIIFITEAFGK